MQHEAAPLANAWRKVCSLTHELDQLGVVRLADLYNVSESSNLGCVNAGDLIVGSLRLSQRSQHGAGQARDDHSTWRSADLQAHSCSPAALPSGWGQLCHHCLGAGMRGQRSGKEARKPAGLRHGAAIGEHTCYLTLVACGITVLCRTFPAVLARASSASYPTSTARPITAPNMPVW